MGSVAASSIAFTSFAIRSKGQGISIGCYFDDLAITTTIASFI